MNDLLENILLVEPESHYGADYSRDRLTQYRDFVGSAETVTDRRYRANQFYLGINTALIGGISFAGLDRHFLMVVAAIAGFAICLAWWGSIRSYRELNAAKFTVIKAMERHLPAAPYTAEEATYQSGSLRYVILSKWESWVPIVYAALHLGVGISGVLGFME